MAIKTGQRMSLRRTLLLSKHTQYRHAHGRSEQPLFAHGKRPERCRKMHAQTGLATFETLWKTRQPGPAQLSMPYRRAYSTALPLETTRAQDRSALLQARIAMITRREKLRRGKGRWINCLELLGIVQGFSIRVASPELDVLKYEDEYRSSVDAGKRLATLRVQVAKHELRLQQTIEPLNTHANFMRELSHIMRHCPYNRLQKSSWCLCACADDLEQRVIELSALHRCRPPSIWKRKYELSRLSEHLFRLHACISKDLTMAIFQEIDFPSGPGSERLQIDFKSFLGQYIPCAQYVSRGNKDHHAIMLRRSSATSKERLYTALNHGFRSSQSSIRDIVKHSTREFQRIFQRRVRFQAHASRWADALKTVHKLEEDLSSTTDLYQSEYDPVFSLLLDFMTPEEIERRNESMGNYWFRYWQMQKQKDDREAHFETCQIAIRKARNGFRKKNKKTWERKGHWKRFDPANDVAQPSLQHQWRKQYGDRKPGKYRN